MSDLRNLKNEIEEKKWKSLAEWVIKYQEFKLSVALTKFDGKFYDLSDSSKRNYFVEGVSYIRKGKRYRYSGLSSKFFKWIDVLNENCLQALIPAKDQECKKLNRKPNYQKRNAEVPIAKLDIIKNKITETFEYGVLFNQVIYLLNDDKEANIFLRGIKATNNEAKIVSVRFEEET